MQPQNYGPVDKPYPNRPKSGTIYFKGAVLMMGKKDTQMQMMIVDIESLIPENHLYKKDKQLHRF